jgi:hypothetical protein
MMKLRFSLFLLAALFCCACNSSDSSRVPVGDVETLRTALAQDGFEIQNGLLVPMDPAELFCAGVLPSCYALNNDSPYLVYLLPKAPNQVADNLFPWTYRVRSDEAIVFVGVTPPEVKYFSYKMYIAGRYYSPTAPERIYASLGDTISNFRINTTDRNYPYKQPVMIISTADRGVEARIRAAALQAGYSVDIMNTDIIPSDLIKMGIEADKDELTFLHRVAFFKNNKDQTDYMVKEPLIVGKHLISPPYTSNNRGYVFRVTPKSGKEPTPDPYPVPSLIPRGSGTNEFQYFDSVEDLRTAILGKHTALGATVKKEYEPYLWFVEGFEAIQRSLLNGYDVYGEVRDTIYLRTDSFDFGEKDFMIIYGVIHARTGKATYSNLNIYTEDEDPVSQKPINLGFMSANSEASSSSGIAMQGSAKSYIPDHRNADLLYAIKVARNCNGENYCLQVPVNGSACPRITYNKLFAAFRAYVDPVTKVGPVSHELILDRLILFTQ